MLRYFEASCLRRSSRLSIRHLATVCLKVPGDRKACLTEALHFSHLRLTLSVAECCQAITIRMGCFAIKTGSSNLDVRDFFGTVSREWLIRFLEHRIGDQRILRLIRKWLRAGVLKEGGRDGRRGRHASRGNGFPFDLWEHQWRKRHATGDVIIVRYADDGAPRRREGGFMN